MRSCVQEDAHLGDALNDLLATGRPKATRQHTRLMFSHTLHVSTGHLRPDSIQR
jgi:hypothetical protein